MKNVLVTGANGFLGQAVQEEFTKNCSTMENLHTFKASDYDLRDMEAIKSLLSDKPADTIIHLAASVGGIGANQMYPGTFFYENLMMGAQLIEQARHFGVKRFVNIGTICSYPKFTPVPFKEEELWNGYPEETNAPYGIAKKALIVQLEAYKQEFGFDGTTFMCVNLYGPRDNFDLEKSHVIPAMMRKFHMAKEFEEDSVTLWGDGSPSREFLYVEDAARAIRMGAERFHKPGPINIGTGKEITMRDLAELIGKVVEFDGEIKWNTDKPNGQPRRCLDVTKAKEEFGFEANISLPVGIELTYEWFKENFKEIKAAERAAAEEGASVS